MVFHDAFKFKLETPNSSYLYYNYYGIHTIVNNHIAIETVTLAEIRDRLKGMGVTIQATNIKMLQQMYIDAVEAAPEGGS